MTLDNDATPTTRPPSADIPSADSPAAPAPPDAAPPMETAEERKRRLTNDRVKRHRANKAPGASSTPRPARAAGPVQRTDPAPVDFNRYNGGRSFATSTEAKRAARGVVNPFADAAAARPAEPTKPALTPEQVAPYAGAVALWVTMGFIALAERQKVPPEEREFLLGAVEPMVRKIVYGATERVCIKYGLELPYLDEGILALAIGIPTATMFLGTEGKGIANMPRYFALAAAAGATGGAVPTSSAPTSAGEAVDTTAREVADEKPKSTNDDDGAAVADKEFKV